MSLFRNPLRLWRVRFEEFDEPLDTTKCHATSTTKLGGSLGNEDRHQCANKPKTTRPFAGHDEPLPVCGLHARTHDKALDEHKKWEVRSARADQLSDRCEVLREAGLESACSTGENGMVLVRIDELEAVCHAAGWTKKT